jgi:hypothetical protein
VTPELIELSPGSVFAERYRVLQPLHRGTSAIDVVEPLRLAGSRRALKRLSPDALSESRRLGFTESVCATQVVPGIAAVAVLDTGFDAENGAPWLVMELLEGESLAQRVERAGPCSAEEGRRILEELCRALGAAHAAGLVHGGLRPSRLFVHEAHGDGRVPLAILGYGLAGLLERGLPSHQSLLWMAPEQLVPAGRLTPATDVWAIGLIAFELLTGRGFWRADGSTAMLLGEICFDPMPVLVAALPPGFDAWFARCVARDPALRFEDAAAAGASLRGGRAVTFEALSDFGSFGAPPPGFGPPGFGPPPGGFWPPLAPAPAFGQPPPMTHPSESFSAPSPMPATRPEPPRVDENVQFTVYRPKVVRPETWVPLLAFAHLAERRPDAPPGEPDPIAEVVRQATQVLGAQVAEFRSTTDDSSEPIPAEGEITFVPEAEGITFNPRRRTFLWVESVQREEFHLRASRALDGKVARGRLTVFLGSILVADVNFTLRVDSGHALGDEPSQRDQARPYRKIFASYSHKDTAMVEQFERYVEALGDRYLRDALSLRSGEVWSDGLKQLIEQADVFQLFWSKNAMRSPYVRKEWEYALSLHRPSFVRPTYWEDPLPALPEEGLPPEDLVRLHFHHLGGGPEHTPAEGAVEPRHTAAALPVDDAWRATLAPAMLRDSVSKDAPAGGLLGPAIASVIVSLIALATYLLLRSC